MQLAEWGIGGYKSIEGLFEFSVGGVNIIVGRNNSGKSSIKDSLLDYQDRFTGGNPNQDWLESRSPGKEFSSRMRFQPEFRLSDEEYDGLLQTLRERGLISGADIDDFRDQGNFRRIRHFLTYSPEGNRDVVTANFENQWLPIRFTNHANTVRSINLPHFLAEGDFNWRGPRDGNSPWRPIKSILEGAVNSWESIGAFREPQDQMAVFNTTDLQNDGGNLVQVLNTLKNKSDDRFDRIAQTYTKIMDGVEWIHTPLRGNQDTTISIEETGFDARFDFREISSGSKEILTLITSIVLAEENTDLLLIEEPELHLHPTAERRIFDLVEETVSSSDGLQVIISTHSDTFVNLSQANSIIRVERDETSGETSIQSISESGVDETLIELGYDKSDLFHSSFVVFVEGRSDQRIFEEWSRTLANTFDRHTSFDDMGVTVYAVGGDRIRSHGEELANLVGRLRIPYTFVVDSDDQDPEDKKDDLVSELDTKNIHVLSEYCIESYLLEAPSAIADAFRYDLDDVEEFIQDAESRPNKKEVIKDLYRELEEGEVSYDEEMDGSMIARHMDADEIDAEIERVISEIERVVGAD